MNIYNGILKMSHITMLYLNSIYSIAWQFLSLYIEISKCVRSVSTAAGKLSMLNTRSVGFLSGEY